MCIPFGDTLYIRMEASVIFFSVQSEVSKNNISSLFILVRLWEMGSVNNTKYEFVYLLVYIYEDFYTFIWLSMWLCYLHNYLYSYISMHRSISLSSSSSSRSVPWPVRPKTRSRGEHLTNLHLHISFDILRVIYHCTKYLGE